MPLCPAGHESEWEDYCSVCGISMNAPAESPSGAPTAPVEQVALGEAEATCPNCGEIIAAGDVFCENCGYDLLTGTLPDEPEAAAPFSSNDEAATTVAVISVDLAFFDRMGFEGVDPPATLPDPVRLELPPTDVLVGRHSKSRGIFPEIDLGGVFGDEAADPAVSSSHCRLHRGAHGWTVTDLSSTNGTYIADSADPIAAGNPITLTPDTPIFVGAWTRIDLE